MDNEINHPHTASLAYTGPMPSHLATTAGLWHHDTCQWMGGNPNGEGHSFVFGPERFDIRCKSRGFDDGVHL